MRPSDEVARKKTKMMTRQGKKDMTNTNETSGQVGGRHAVPTLPLILAAALAIGVCGNAGADSRSGDASPETPAADEQRPLVEVWKSPTCGCCSGWVAYLEEEGFEVVAHDTDDVDAVKTALGLVDPRLKSCHTATVEGYVIEGHVPVSDIERLLAEHPDVTGISAPGMPMMSPGMGSREPKGYDVVSFDEAGEVRVFTSH